MQTTFRWLLYGTVLLGALIPLAPAGATAVPPHQPRDEVIDLAALDHFVMQNLQAANLPGAAVAITTGTQVLHVRGYGHDSRGAPIAVDTPFRIASLSKPFTALAVMQLVDAGSVALDTRVATYLPEFVTADPRSDAITVRQLLNQTSGMADRGFPEVSLPQPTTLQAAVARLRTATLVADPGTQWNYHNPNYQVAARLVEVVASEPFAAYLERHIFTPLGMTHSTTTDTDDELVAGLADGYSFAYGQAIALPGPGFFVGGSGGIVSTAADLARWLTMLNNGGRSVDGKPIVSSQSLRDMYTPIEPGGYALGWDSDGPVERPTRIEHGGCCFAWAAHAALLPERNYGVVVLLNSAAPVGLDQQNVVEGVLALVNGEVPEPAPVSSRTIDAVLGVLTLLVLVLGVVGMVRSKRWATRQAQRPVWRTMLCVLPHLILIAVCVAFPGLAGLSFGGREVTWFTTLYNWFALLLLVLVVALAEVSVTSMRLLRLLRWRRQVAGA